MNKMKEKVLKTIVKAIEKSEPGDGTKWPPTCCGFIYQPKRPKKNRDEERV